MYPESFINKDQQKLAVRGWPINDSKANIILLHGYAEHSGRYEYESELFNEQGYSVFAYDHRGYGRSEGERAYINRFSEYLDDLEIYLRSNKELFESKPLFLFGHSMGGLIWVSYLLERNFDLSSFRGLVLSAPALEISKNISPFLQKISGLLSFLFPKLQTLPLDNTTLSHDPLIQEEHEKDPLNYKGKTKARTGGEMIRQTKSLTSKFTSFNHPFIALHGTSDKHAEIEGTRNFYKKASSKDKEIVEMVGMFHEVTKEVEKDKVISKMVEWMNNRI